MLIVGERINASRKRVALAVEARDADFLRYEATRQVEAGAHILDVNVGTFVDEETELLAWAVQAIQQDTDIPLCLDSPNPEAVAAALRVHAGKAVINSISAEKGRFDAILPMVKEHQCGVIALCVSDEGVPGTAEGKFEIASDLIGRLTDEGVPRTDIYLDPVVSPISMNIQASMSVLETIERVRQSFDGVHTICGLSNISFGLPLRKQINRTFLAMVMASGLDTAMIDPCDTGMMAILITAMALLGKDERLTTYLSAYREGRFDPSIG